MFQDFAKKKFNDYVALLEFPAGRISFNNIRTSFLPPFIINFFDNFLTEKNIPLDKKDFEEILNKAVIFNINYIVKPKNTILKFLFGNIETRPVDFINYRLRYFQFYGYYITQIMDFINVNSPEVLSSEQIEYLIDGVNKKILEEISSSGNDANRLNLVKLPYYFFHDLDVNNPINIKLPKKILSVFFLDKGFYDIKNRVDTFFSDEIFIQEAIELMNPETKKSLKTKSDVEVSDEQIKQIVSKVKAPLAGEEIPEKEHEKMQDAEEKPPEDIEKITIKFISENKSKLPSLEKSELIIDEEIYSDDLIFASQFNDLTSPVKLTDEELRIKLINDLFCEETFRKKIIKNIFNKSEGNFKESVTGILNETNWQDATRFIEKIFNKNKTDYFSEEAIKFVDIMQSHFVKPQTSESKAS